MNSINGISTKKMIKNIQNLSNSSEEKILKTFDKINDNLDFDIIYYKSTYLKFSIIEENTIRKFKNLSKVQQSDLNYAIECAIDKEELNSNPIFYEKFKNLTHRIFNKLMSIIPPKRYLRLIRLALSMSLCLIGMPIPVFAQASTLAVKLNVLFEAVVSLSSLVIFACLSCEIIQHGIKKDVAVIWQIALKYLLIIVLLLSYKPVFRFLTEFFSDL